MADTNSSLNSSVVAVLMAASLHLRTMADTNSSFFGVIGAPPVATLLHLCTMARTNSSSISFIGAPPVAASLHLCTMPRANSSLNISIGAPPVAVLLHLRTMPTDSSLFGIVVAPLLAASLPRLCAMSHANPSDFGLVGASIEGADMSVFFRCPDAFIFFTLIFHNRFWLVGFMRQRQSIRIFFLARRLEACWCCRRQWHRRCVDLYATTAAAFLAVQLCL